MKCLVTGSEGFIGKNLVERLEKDGHEVEGFDPKISYGHGAHEILNRKATGDVIFHLGCVNQMQALSQPDLNLGVNALLTKKLAEYAASIGAKFIYTSTASVYGNARVIPTPVGERLVPLTDYAVAKLAGEFFVQNSGADWTILRLSNVYGPHQTLENPYCGVIGRFFEQARNGEPLSLIGDGSQTRDFTYVGDVVHRIVMAGSEHRHPNWSRAVLNLSYGKETRIVDLATKIASLYGNDYRINLIPPRPIDSIDRRCLIPSLHCPTDIDAGLARTKEWFDATA